MKFRALIKGRFQSGSKSKKRARSRKKLKTTGVTSRSAKNRCGKLTLKSAKEAEKISIPLFPALLTNQVSVIQPQGELTVQELLSGQDVLKSLKKCIEGFLLDMRSENTRLSYAKDLKRFWKFLVTRDRSEKLDRFLIVHYKESLLFESLAQTTVDRHLATLRSFFDWAVEEGVLAQNPASKVRFLNPKRLSKTIGFTNEEVLRVLSRPNLHRRIGCLHYAVLMLLFYCGLRRSEVCSLKMGNLSTERGHRVLRLIGKGNSERILPLVTQVESALDLYLLITGRQGQQSHAESPLFVPVINRRSGEVNKHLDPSLIFYIVKKYAREAGIQSRVSPHSCRATAISNARDHQVADRAIQEFAGWSSPAMITRYDKRKTAIEQSAAFAIKYQTQITSHIHSIEPVIKNAENRPQTHP